MKCYFDNLDYKRTKKINCLIQGIHKEYIFGHNVGKEIRTLKEFI